jgi:diguanylate cyclase (GGDEF)-like protein/PAS domain S-box-containing protein
MIKYISQSVELSLKKANIKQLLRFIVISCSASILILALSTIIIEKLSSDSQKKLVDQVFAIETLIKSINDTISSLMLRNENIELAEDTETLTNLSDRDTLERKFITDIELLKELLPVDTNNLLIDNYNNSFVQFLSADSDLYLNKEKIIHLKNELQLNELALETIVNEIIGAIDKVTGKIKLKESRARLKIKNNIIDEEQSSFSSYSRTLDNLLEQHLRVEEASNQVQFAAIQIIQLAQKLTQTTNKDVLVDVKDNEIAQQLSQIQFFLDSLSVELKNHPKLMADIVIVSRALEKLFNVLIKNERSIYNLWTQYLDLNFLIENDLKIKMKNHADIISNTTIEIENFLYKIIDSNKEQTDKVIKLSYAIIIFISLIVLVFIITVLRSLDNRINQPLKLIGHAVDNLTRGNLRARLDTKDFVKDEFSLLAESFNTFAERNEQLFNELSTTYDALLENEHRLNAVLENALVGIVHLKDRKFISVNNKFEEMFGYEREEITGFKTEIIFPSKKDFDEIGRQAYKKLQENDTYNSEWIVKHKDGHEFWCAISAKSIEDGKPELGSIWLYEDITKRKHNEEQLTMLANFDVLTGLPNRALFVDRLENYISLAERKKQKISVMFIDLDRFKQVNDSLGHETGDKLLIAVAEKLNKCVRSSDTVARLGGDEFTIILTDIKNELAAERTAIKVINSFRETIDIDGQEISISPSIGISMYPDDSVNVSDLLRNSDAAMYHAKELGRNNYQFYIDEMNSESLNKITLESRLRHAVKNNDFELYFQKQFNVIENKTVGYEALLRWHTASGEVISPDSFIPILEDSGMINIVGEWVISEACRYGSLFMRKNADPIKIAVNLSARQFQSKNLLRHIENSINKYKLSPSDLELEITETVLMTGSKHNKSIINELHDMGCKIVLDDFGTGYSSLAYLKQFPIDVIKIDRSFIRDILTDPSDAAICNAIRAMAESLNVKVIAEGVETKEQLDYLLANNFTIVQGYYYGKPEHGQKMISEKSITPLKLIK